MYFSCARLQVTKSAQRGSTFADHCVSGLHEGRIPSSILHLVKPRVARGISTWALADGYMQRALTRKEARPLSPSQGSGFYKREPRVFDPRTRESRKGKNF
jgi:hypothetical protein